MTNYQSYRVNRIKRLIDELNLEKDRADIKNFSWEEQESIYDSLNKAVGIFDDHLADESMKVED